MTGGRDQPSHLLSCETGGQLADKFDSTYSLDSLDSLAQVASFDPPASHATEQVTRLSGSSGANWTSGASESDGQVESNLSVGRPPVTHLSERLGKARPPVTRPSN